MIVTIHQPEHLPWLGYFNKMAKAELYVILDNVQYEKNYFQNRNKIIGPNGIQWLGIPVKNGGHTRGTIATTQIASDGKWKKKYLNTIKMSYGRHPYFAQVMPIVELIINQKTDSLCDVNIALIKKIASGLNIFPKFIKASELNVVGAKSDLILNICKATKATTYIAGPSGRDYLNIQSFEENNIKVVYNDYIHPFYEQKRQKEFIPYMSSIDLIMNYGFQESKKIIMQGNEDVNEV